MDEDELRQFEEAGERIRAARLSREADERDQKDREARKLSRQAEALATWRSDAKPLFERVLAAVGEKIDPADVTFGLRVEDENRAHPYASFNFTSPTAGRQTCVIRMLELAPGGQVRTRETIVTPDKRTSTTGPDTNVAPVDALTESHVLKLVRQSYVRFADLDAD